MQPDMDRDAVARERARHRQVRAEQVQRRRMALGIMLLALIVLVLALVIGLSGRGGGSSVSSTTTSTTGQIASGNYSAKLTGAQSVPKVTTQAAGVLVLTYDAAKKQLSYGLDITKGLKKPSTAAIYEGKPGTSGRTVYMLTVTDANAASGTSFVGTLCNGVVDKDNLIGPLAGKTLADLITLIKDGDAYVSVGTPTHPVDAIRGQIQ